MRRTLAVFEIVHEESVKVYLHIHVQRECSAEPSICVESCVTKDLSPVLAYEFLSRCKFSTLTSTPLYSTRLYAQNPVFENVHQQKSVNGYLHIYVQRECSAEPFMRRILCH